MTTNNDKATVIIVDDNITNLTVGMSSLVEKYNVLTAPSGKKLFVLLEKVKPALILLDIEMPEMNGYDVIRALKSKPETTHIPVIFLTGKDDSDNELAGLSLGAVDYVSKPFSPPLLLKRIELHLLVETQKQELEAQKQELVNFNDNLQSMVDAKTRMVIELQNAVLKTMAELVECRDDITGAHIERTQRYLQILLNELIERQVYSEETALWDITLVLPSAQLHDIGKIAVRDCILQKPGKLTAEEFEAIKIHPSFGAQIIEKIEKSTTDKRFLKYAKVFALTHHEKWDGSGYPSGLQGKDIPLQGRIMAVADVYDALTSQRSYKQAFTHAEAVKIISEGSGQHFDPVLVDVFLSVEHDLKKSAGLQE